MLVVDLDPQGNATSGLGLRPLSRHGIHLSRARWASRRARDLAQPTQIDNSVHVPSGRDLAGAEVELISVGQRERRLQQALAPTTRRLRFHSARLPTGCWSLDRERADGGGWCSGADSMRVLRARGPEPAAVDDQSRTRQPQPAPSARGRAADHVRRADHSLGRRRRGGASPPWRRRCTRRLFRAVSAWPRHPATDARSRATALNPAVPRRTRRSPRRSPIVPTAPRRRALRCQSWRWAHDCRDGPLPVGPRPRPGRSDPAARRDQRRQSNCRSARSPATHTSRVRPSNRRRSTSYPRASPSTAYSSRSWSRRQPTGYTLIAGERRLRAAETGRTRPNSRASSGRRPKASSSRGR